MGTLQRSIRRYGDPSSGQGCFVGERQQGTNARLTCRAVMSVCGRQEYVRVGFLQRLFTKAQTIVARQNRLPYDVKEDNVYCRRRRCA